MARPTWPFTSCQASLAAHPAFHRNLRTLSDWGVTVLANESIRYGAAAGQSFNWEPVTRAVMAARDLDER